MTTHTLTANSDATFWEKFWNLGRAIDSGFDFDPAQQAQASVDHLTQKVTDLEAAVRRLEIRVH